MTRIYLFICAFCLSFTQLSGQCFPDRHSTNWFDGWASCETNTSPNATRGEGHWIMYDFDNVYALGQMHVWNVNDPAHLDWGMQEVEIDYSVDGITWESAGAFILSQGSGLNTYEGSAGPDLVGVEAQYLLITAVSNWGGSCYGISELQIEAEEVIVSSVSDLPGNACFTTQVMPNPFVDGAHVNLNSSCAGVLEYRVLDMLGNTVLARSEFLEIGTMSLYLSLRDLQPGGYILSMRLNDVTHHEKLVKLSR